MIAAVQYIEQTSQTWYRDFKDRVKKLSLKEYNH